MRSASIVAGNFLIVTASSSPEKPEQKIIVIGGNIGGNFEMVLEILSLESIAYVYCSVAVSATNSFGTFSEPKPLKILLVTGVPKTLFEPVLQTGEPSSQGVSFQQHLTDAREDEAYGRFSSRSEQATSQSKASDASAKAASVWIICLFTCAYCSTEVILGNQIILHHETNSTSPGAPCPFY
jgi:hypothetical protein